MMSMQEAQRKIARWRHDPIAFVRENFDIEPDEWQKEFLYKYVNNNRIASKACKGPGKTCVLSWCAWHFLACNPHAKMAAISITGDNLRDGLWAEMSKWQIKSKFLNEAFVWTAKRIFARDHKQTWFMSARTWSKDATGDQQANTLAGLHADNIMFVLDEVGGIPDSVMSAAEAILSNEGVNAKIIICGNPTHLSGPLYRACTSEKSLWAMIEITGDPDDPKRSPRISKQWAREQIKKYGRDNAWVLVNVFGKFPPGSLNGLIGPDDMRAAMNRVVHVDSYAGMPKILGVDVALQGDDRTVIAPRQGIVGFKPKVLRTPKPREIASVVANAWNKWGAHACFIDNTGGWGSGVISHLQEWGFAPIGIQFAGKASDAGFKNKRAEMAWSLADWVLAGGCLPQSDDLVEEATAITYFHNKDKVQIIEKQQIKDTLGRSPDLFDAYGLTFAYPVAKPNPTDKYKTKNVDGNYNPMAREYAPQNVSSTDRGDYDPLR